MNPSPRVLVCMSGRQHSGQGSPQHLARKDIWSQVDNRTDKVLSPARQSLWWPMPREISMAWSSTLVCGARLSQQWAGAYLSYTLEGSVLHPFGSLDNCLGIPDGEWGLFPRSLSIYRFCSADMAVLVPCADILGVPSCQTCPASLR